MSPRGSPITPPKLSRKAALAIRVQHAQDRLEAALADLERYPADALVRAVVIGRWKDLKTVKALVPGEGAGCADCTWRATIVRDGKPYCVRHDPVAYAARANFAIERQRRREVARS